ncbi:MAG: type II secretion system F family protein [Peptostreptococcaceae bacterium]|nr:type II secretion system F family protein [Peptostreptococcaceae bacterium]
MMEKNLIQKSPIMPDGFFAKIQSKLMSGKKLSMEKKRDFYYMLGFYLASKMPILDALDLVHNDTQIACIPSLLTKIDNGARLVDALEEVNLTDDFIYSCLLIGENTGSYPKAFENIVRYLEQRVMDKKYFLRITAYPVFLILMILLILSFVIFVVSPQLYKTIASIGIRVPKSLEILHGIYLFFVNYARLLAFVLIAIFCFFLSGISREKIAHFAKRILLKQRLIMAFYQMSTLRSIFWQIEVLFASGMDIVSAIRIVSEGSDLFGYGEILREIADGITHGKTMHEMMQKNELYFPKAIISYIKLGETTDSLHENLSNAVRLLNIKTEDMAENTKKLLQPMMIIIAGILISLLLALVLPIINSATNLGGLR